MTSNNSIINEKLEKIYRNFGNIYYSKNPPTGEFIIGNNKNIISMWKVYPYGVKRKITNSNWILNDPIVNRVWLTKFENFLSIFDSSVTSEILLDARILASELAIPNFSGLTNKKNRGINIHFFCFEDFKNYINAKYGNLRFKIFFEFLLMPNSIYENNEGIKLIRDFFKHRVRFLDFNSGKYYDTEIFLVKGNIFNDYGSSNILHFLLDGNCKTFYPDGLIKEVCSYFMGYLNGKYTRYHHGQNYDLVLPSQEGTYSYGLKISSWIKIKENRYISEKCLYENGILTQKEKFFVPWNKKPGEKILQGALRSKKEYIIENISPVKEITQFKKILKKETKNYINGDKHYTFEYDKTKKIPEMDVFWPPENGYKQRKVLKYNDNAYNIITNYMNGNIRSNKVYNSNGIKVQHLEYNRRKTQIYAFSKKNDTDILFSRYYRGDGEYFNETSIEPKLEEYSIVKKNERERYMFEISGIEKYFNIIEPFNSYDFLKNKDKDGNTILPGWYNKHIKIPVSEKSLDVNFQLNSYIYKYISLFPKKSKKKNGLTGYLSYIDYQIDVENLNPNDFTIGNIKKYEQTDYSYDEPSKPKNKTVNIKDVEVPLLFKGDEVARKNGVTYFIEGNSGKISYTLDYYLNLISSYDENKGGIKIDFSKGSVKSKNTGKADFQISNSTSASNRKILFEITLTNYPDGVINTLKKIYNLGEEVNSSTKEIFVDEMNYNDNILQFLNFSTSIFELNSIDSSQLLKEQITGTKETIEDILKKYGKDIIDLKIKYIRYKNGEIVKLSEIDFDDIKIIFNVNGRIELTFNKENIYDPEILNNINKNLMPLMILENQSLPSTTPETTIKTETKSFDKNTTCPSYKFINLPSEEGIKKIFTSMNCVNSSKTNWFSSDFKITNIGKDKIVDSVNLSNAEFSKIIANPKDYWIVKNMGLFGLTQPTIIEGELSNQKDNQSIFEIHRAKVIPPPQQPKTNQGGQGGQGGQDGQGSSSRSSKKKKKNKK